MIQMNLFTKQKETHRLREQIYGYQGVKVVGKDRLADWDGHIHTVIFKMDNQQEPTYSLWNSVQCYVASQMGGEFGGEWIHVYDG